MITLTVSQENRSKMVKAKSSKMIWRTTAMVFGGDDEINISNRGKSRGNRYSQSHYKEAKKYKRLGKPSEH